MIAEYYKNIEDSILFCNIFLRIDESHYHQLQTYSQRKELLFIEIYRFVQEFYRNAKSRKVLISKFEK